MVRGWVRALGGPPLVDVIADGGARDLIESCARERGYEVLGAQRGLAAYRLALEQRPLAVISDQLLPDCSGRELLAALRRDFLVREVPFIMIPAADVARRGDRGADSVLQGLAAVLTPGCAFHQRVMHSQGDVNGWVEPIGVTRLITTLEALAFDGELRLDRAEPDGRATLTFRGGALGAVAVNLGGSSAGSQGLTDVVGYEWRAYSVAKLAAREARPSGAQALLEVARKQNNALLQLIYERGTKVDGIRIDSAALDRYLQTVPPACLEPLIRIVDGDAPKDLATPESEAMLRSLLYEMRRQAAIRIESPEAIGQQDGRVWSVFTARAPRQTGVPPGSEKEAVQRQEKLRKERGTRRLLVVGLAFLLTLVLVLSGLFGAHRLLGPRHALGGIWSRVWGMAGLLSPPETTPSSPRR